MKFALVLVAALAAFAAADDVLVLTESNFDDTVNNADIILVEFYAPWCGHCKRLEPEYAKAATTLKEEGVKLAKVDATEEASLAQRHGVRGYPTLKIFRKGQRTDYGGPRDHMGIVNYMRKQNGPAAKPLKTVAEVEKFLDTRDAVVVGFFSKEGSALEKEYVAAAEQLRDDFFLGVSHESEVLDKYGKDQVVLFQKLDGAQHKYEAGSVVNWIWENSVAVVGEMTPDNRKKFQMVRRPVLQLFTALPWDASTDDLLNRLRTVAKENGNHEKLAFAVADKNNAAFKRDTDAFACDAAKPVCLTIDANGKKFRDDSAEVTEATLRAFVEGFLNNKLEPFIKSEPIPANNDGGVKVVVGKTFEEIVLDDSQDVLIEMYAPWCGHCKKLEPDYNKLGDLLKEQGVKNLVIAKMDATANDATHQAYVARGYPTILFAKRGQKDRPIKYDGARDVDSFVNWLKNKATAWETSSAKEEL